MTFESRQPPGANEPEKQKELEALRAKALEGVDGDMPNLPKELLNKDTPARESEPSADPERVAEELRQKGLL